MDIREWISTNYDDLRFITQKIIKSPDDIDDLLHVVLEDMLKKENKLNNMPDKQKRYWFVRVLKNNYFSKSSQYYYQYKSYNTHTSELTTQDIEEEEYEELIPDMDWVKSQLNTLDWFSRDLFLYWMEMGTITKLSKETTIPLNSVGKYIKDIKYILQKKYETEINGGKR